MVIVNIVFCILQAKVIIPPQKTKSTPLLNDMHPFQRQFNNEQQKNNPHGNGNVAKLAGQRF